jgi:Mg-chelatase subunit ChlI
VTTALYRRYRPETFGEMIGQAQVTEPLMTALRSDRVGHAYLFSGPRGCGKTTSARILARCLNCAQGPTDTPCGVCDSCVELGRGGGVRSTWSRSTRHPTTVSTTPAICASARSSPPRATASRSSSSTRRTW